MNGAAVCANVSVGGGDGKGCRSGSAAATRGAMRDGSTAVSTVAALNAEPTCLSAGSGAAGTALKTAIASSSTASARRSAGASLGVSKADETVI